MSPQATAKLCAPEYRRFGFFAFPAPFSKKEPQKIETA
jgi:hypothetical protein